MVCLVPFFNIFGVAFAGFCSRFEVSLRSRVEDLFDVFSRTGVGTGVVLGGENA
jgi:hypothetical protein